MARGDGGVLSVTIAPAIREMLAAKREKRKPRLGVVKEKAGRAPTPENLVDGSSNISKCAVAARLLLGDKKSIPLAHLWLARELGHTEPRVGFCGLEAPSTSYFALAHGVADLAMIRADIPVVSHAAIEHFAGIVNILAAMTRPGTTGPQAASGPRCVAEKMVGGEDVLKWLMTGKRFKWLTVDPTSRDFSPLRWLLNELNSLGARPEFDAARIWLTDGTAEHLAAELAKIQLGSGHLRIRHYRDSEGRWGVVSYWPRGLMSPAVGDAKKCARRLGAMVGRCQGCNDGTGDDNTHHVMGWSPIGFVAHSDIGALSDGEPVIDASYPVRGGEDNMDGALLELPPGECYQQFDIAREPHSWPEGWKEPGE